MRRLTLPLSSALGTNMNISPEQAFGTLIAAVIILSFLVKLIPQPKPKEKTFKCTRCKKISPHTPRTIEAWRNKKTTFFCQACHAKWLESRPPKEYEHTYHGGGGGHSSRSGCLGLVVLFALVPVACLYLVHIYA